MEFRVNKHYLSIAILTEMKVYSQTDLNEFWVTFAQNIPFGTGPTLKAVDGATAPVSNIMNAGPESDLDFQISYPIIYPQKEILFQTDDDYYEANYIYEGFLNNFLDAIDGSYCTYSAFGETGNSPLDPPYPDPNTGGYKGALQCGVYKPTNVISISYGGQEFDLPASYQSKHSRVRHWYSPADSHGSQNVNATSL